MILINSDTDADTDADSDADAGERNRTLISKLINFVTKNQVTSFREKN